MKRTRKLPALLAASLAFSTVFSANAFAAAPATGPIQVKGGLSLVCDRGDAENVWCFLDTPDFPGGSVAVDVEITNPAQPTTRRWTLRANLAPACHADFNPTATPASWVCHNVTGDGWLHLSVPKLGEERAVVGLRWG